MEDFLRCGLFYKVRGQGILKNTSHDVLDKDDMKDFCSGQKEGNIDCMGHDYLFQASTFLVVTKLVVNHRGGRGFKR